MRENRLYMPLLWQLPEYCEQFRLYRLQVVQANGSRQGTPLYNRPCIVGACASPNKNRLHTVSTAGNVICLIQLHIDNLIHKDYYKVKLGTF